MDLEERDGIRWQKSSSPKGTANIDYVIIREEEDHRGRDDLMISRYKIREGGRGRDPT